MGVPAQPVRARAHPLDRRRSARRRAPACWSCLTGREVAESMNPIPEAWDTAEIGAKGVHWYALASDRVRYVGEVVAAVVAEDRWTAYAALDVIVVDYEELPVVTDPTRRWSRAPLVEPDWGDNLLISRDFVLATRTRRSRTRRRRHRARALEPDHRRPDRAAGLRRLVRPVRGELTYWDSTQNPHPLRSFLAETLGMPEGSIHVIQPHVGGGVRAQAAAVPGGAAGRLGLEDARTAREVDRGARGELPGDGPLARHAVRLRGRLRLRRHGHRPPACKVDRRRRRADRAAAAGACRS